MPKTKNKNIDNFGARLAALRKATGYTQAELAEEINISQRMVAYYEKQTEHPPTKLLPDLAKALGISSDELLGIKPIKKKNNFGNSRLQRKLHQIDSLPANKKRQILQLIDTFIEHEQLKKK